MAVRAFYLDLAQWALDDPARWGQWAVPCPIRASDIQYKKQKARTKARMDARTRERLPVMPALAAAVEQNRKDAAARLDAARAALPGELFTAGGQTLRRADTWSSHRTWAEDPADGKRRDLGREEDNAFWAWAAIQVLTHTGIRLEELTELSHHSLIQYRLPTSGELVPRCRSRRPRPTPNGSSSSTRSWPTSCPPSSPAPAQPTAPSRSSRPTTSTSAPGTRRCPCCSSGSTAWRRQPIAAGGIRDLIRGALASSGITGTDGKPLDFRPHDFRRIFTTDAILNGMPPHIAQILLGHADINTTMGYKAVYPKKPSTATAPTSPAAASSAPARNTDPRAKPSGTSSSATSSAAASHSATADAPTQPAASTSTPASDAPS